MFQCMIRGRNTLNTGGDIHISQNLAIHFGYSDKLLENWLYQKKSGFGKYYFLIR